MSDETKKPKTLSLSGSGKLSLGGTIDAGALRGGGTSGRSKTVQVEVRRKRVPLPPSRQQAAKAAPAAPVSEPKIEAPETPAIEADDKLTAAERAKRMQLVREGLNKPAEDDAATLDVQDADQSQLEAAEAAETQAEIVEEVLDPREARRRAELAELEEIEKISQSKKADEQSKRAAENAARRKALED